MTEVPTYAYDGSAVTTLHSRAPNEGIGRPTLVEAALSDEPSHPGPTCGLARLRARDPQLAAEVEEAIAILATKTTRLTAVKVIAELRRRQSDFIPSKDFFYRHAAGQCLTCRSSTTP